MPRLRRGVLAGARRANRLCRHDREHQAVRKSGRARRSRPNESEDGQSGIAAASKSAAWALTNGLRIELAQQGTQVVGLHAGLIDTDLARDFDAPKSSPEEIVRTTLDALERGDGEVLADEITRQVHRGLCADLPVYFQSIAAFRAGLSAH